MSQWTAVGLIVGGAVALAGLAAVAWLGRRRGAAPAVPGGRGAGSGGGTSMGRGGVAGAGTGPRLGRRELLDRGAVALFAGALAGVVASALTFLWPSITGRAGRRYTLGAAGALRDRLATGRPYYVPAGRFYLVAYPAGDVRRARAAYPAAVAAGMDAGFVALSARCTHLGCHVPFCDSSAWFECPCHGSRFNGVGEVRRGPAPRGLDHYAVTVAGGEVVVDTRVLYRGPRPGTDTTGQVPAGPHCSG